MPQTDLQRTDGFQQTFLHGAAHAHHFAGGLHLSTQAVVGIGEFVKGETGHFGDDIVQCRLEGSGGIGQLNFVQRHAHAYLCGNQGNGVAAGFGGQCGGAGHTGIDLNEVVLEGFGVQRKLDVAAAFDFQRTDNFQRTVPKHLIFPVGQGLGRAHHNGVAGVDAHRIQIFHITNGDGGIIAVPHHFVFDFLVATDALFNEYLMDRGKLQAVAQKGQQLLFIVGKPAAGSAQSKRRTQHHGISNFPSDFYAFLYGVGDVGGQHRFAQLFTQLLEQFPVLCPFDTAAAGSQQFGAAFPQYALFLQLNGKVQAGLSADSRQDGVGALIADNFGDVFQRQRFHIDLVRNGGVGHNGGGVGVAQDNLITLFPQSQTGLCAGIVEFGGLTDDNGAGADDENFVNIGSFRHGEQPPPSD